MSLGKPSYVSSQSSFHRAFAPELRQLITKLPIRPDSRTLDVPCGTGFYTEMLAERSQDLVAVDNCEEHIRELKLKLPQADVRCGDAYNLPDAAGTFHVIWCAESLISLQPRQAVKEFARLLHPDGFLAILEVDEYHHVLVNWPVALEAALPMAIHQASMAKYGTALKLSPARLLRRDLKQAGFATVRRKVLTFERQTPYDDATQKFLSGYFEHLRELAYPYLPGELQSQFDALTDPTNSNSLYRKQDTELTVMSAVYYGTKTVRPTLRLQRADVIAKA